ncbi:MAG: bifunctional precorrin-2 dehydrogenase/sirohydrochlorin ferrochelatase [Methanomicrobiales archaeon]|nr:bifunctional precorrin-2 dehydrogenase/sirohydrochlorin ferrochelatase [Methanomicrobiales archaeon]
MIDFSGKRVVIFGGGDVGARKAAYFCEETEVTVISRSFSPAFDELTVRRLEMNLAGIGDYELEGLVKAAFLVVAATQDTVLNDRIGRYCAIRGVMFNNADGKAGDVILPSQLKGTHYTIAISTFGESPGISRFLREHIGQSYPNLDLMIEVQNQLRTTLKLTIPDQVQRSRVLHEVLDDESVWKALEGGARPAWEIIERRYLC